MPIKIFNKQKFRLAIFEERIKPGIPAQMEASLPHYKEVEKPNVSERMLGFLFLFDKDAAKRKYQKTAKSN